MSCGIEQTEKSQDIAAANWQGLLKRLEPQISGWTVFLQTASGRFIPITSEPQAENVVGLVIAWIRDGISPWETKDLAEELALRLSELGVKAVVLLSRRVESFVGYYVSIRL